MKNLFTTILLAGFLANAEEKNIVISLDEVLSAALTKTDTVKSLKAQHSLSESYKSLADANYNWNFEASINYLDNQNESSTPFSPNKINNKGLSLGFNKYFFTGTKFDIRLQGTKNSLEFSPASSVVVPDYYESIGSISLEQNLLKDAFGAATRDNEKSLILQSEKTELQYKQGLADYAVGIIGQFYNSWLSQQKVFAAEKNLKTKQKLLQASKNKYARGAAEKPEFLQAESANLVAQTNLTEAEEELNRNWRELVIKMKAPEGYLEIPAKKIILSDKPLSQDVSGICKTEYYDVDKSQQIKISKLELNSAELKNKSVKLQSRPELNLKGMLSTNGIDEKYSEAQSEVQSNKNPSWFVGLVFKKTLGDDLNKAQKIQSQAELAQQQASYSSTVDEYKIQYRKLCADLNNIKSNLEKLKLVLAKQTERSNLEENRFRLGRSTVLQVIQASDDAVSADLAYKQTLLTEQIFKWKLLNINNQIEDHVAKWIEAGNNE